MKREASTRRRHETGARAILAMVAAKARNAGVGVYMNVVPLSRTVLRADTGGQTREGPFEGGSVFVAPPPREAEMENCEFTHGFSAAPEALGVDLLHVPRGVSVGVLRDVRPAEHHGGHLDDVVGRVRRGLHLREGWRRRGPAAEGRREGSGRRRCLSPRKGRKGQRMKRGRSCTAGARASGVHWRPSCPSSGMRPKTTAPFLLCSPVAPMSGPKEP